jgi:hypothetical protein
MHLVEHRVTIPGEHEIIGLRELSEQESAAVEHDDDLIIRVASSRWFRRLKSLAALTSERVEAVEARDGPHQDEIIACRMAVIAMVEAHQRFVTDAKELLDSEPVSDVKDQTDQALAEVNSSAAWTALASLTDHGAQLAFDRAGALGILTGSREFTPLGTLIEDAAGEVDLAFTAVLLAVADQVLGAARRLRELHVECPQGVPGLLDVTPLVDADDDAEQVSVVPRDLALQDIYEALRLVRTAEKLAELDDETPLVRFKLDDAQEGDSRVERIHDIGEVTEQRGNAEDEAQAREADGEHGRDDQDDESAEENGDGRQLSRSAVDVSGLLSEAARLNETLESAWSQALNRVLTQEGIERQVAALRAAVTGLQRRFEEEGIRLEEFPPGSELLGKLERDPNRAAELIASAQLVAFIETVEKLKALSEPTRVQVKVSQGRTDELTRFWESSAFGRLHATLELLRHLLDEARAEEAAYPLEADRRLRLAQVAWRAGDPEACIFHAVCALASHLGGPCGELERVGLDNPRRPVALAALRALEAQLAGEQVLALATIVAPALADFALDEALPPPGERPIGADELFDLLAEDLPHVPLEED